MKQLFDKDGNAIPKEEIGILIFQAVAEVKRENDLKLAEQIAKFANKRVDAGEQFTVVDANMVISVIKNHDNTHPFAGF